MKVVVFIISVFFILNITSCSPTELAEVKSVSEAEKRVDWLISTHVGYYRDLCKLARNDATKKKFEKFQYVLQDYFSCGENCQKLDAYDQIKVSDYAVRKLKSHPELYKLADSGIIECW